MKNRQGNLAVLCLFMAYVKIFCCAEMDDKTFQDSTAWQMRVADCVAEPIKWRVTESKLPHSLGLATLSPQTFPCGRLTQALGIPMH